MGIVHRRQHEQTQNHTAEVPAQLRGQIISQVLREDENRRSFSHCRHTDKHKQAQSAFGLGQSGRYPSSWLQPFRSPSAGVFQGGCGFWKKTPFPHKLTRVRTRGRRRDSVLLPVRFLLTGSFSQLSISMLHHAELPCSVNIYLYNDRNCEREVHLCRSFPQRI